MVIPCACGVPIVPSPATKGTEQRQFSPLQSLCTIASTPISQHAQLPETPLSASPFSLTLVSLPAWLLRHPRPIRARLNRLMT